MKKSVFIRLALLAMTLLNVVLFTLFLMAPERPDGERPKRIIIRELHLDAEQTARYEQLILKHRAAINELDSRMRSTKKELYQHLGKDGDSNGVAALLNRMGKIQREIEFVHYRHFCEIHQLLRPDQEVYFSRLKNQLSRLFSPPPRPK